MTVGYRIDPSGASGSDPQNDAHYRPSSGGPCPKIAPSQRKLLTDLAAKRGWDAILYDEGGVSAETIGSRPVMKRLLDDVADGRIDLVAVVEMERLCRASDLRDWATISTTFREPDLRGILSKREKQKLLEHTHRGLEQARDAGRFIGGQPMLGYRYDHATHGGPEGPPRPRDGDCRKRGRDRRRDRSTQTDADRGLAARRRDTVPGAAASRRAGAQRGGVHGAGRGGVKGVPRTVAGERVDMPIPQYRGGPGRSIGR